MKDYSIIGAQIAYYRKLNCLTQEELAERVNVSSQAVSKWEQQTSYPDITLLPKLAKLFKITIDELFGLNVEKEVVYDLIEGLPWKDDGDIRIAVYNGTKLLHQNNANCKIGNNIVNFEFHGDSYNINGVCKFNYKKTNK